MLVLSWSQRVSSGILGIFRFRSNLETPVKIKMPTKAFSVFKINNLISV